MITRKNKLLALVFLALAVIALLLLATSLPRLEFLPGQPFSLDVSPLPAGGEPPTALGDFLLIIFRGVLALAILFLPVYVLIQLLTKEGRKKLLKQAIFLAISLLLLEYVTQVSSQLALQNLPQGSEGSQPPLFATPAGPKVTFEAHTPLWLELLVIVGVALSAAVLVFFLLDFFVRRKTPPLARSFERLAQEAQNAVDALQAGGDVKDIVIRSYLQMSLVVREELGLARERAMTPDEFEQTLVSTGVPRQPVHRLTRLFEEVRYGNRPTGREDERQAVADLRAIAAFCRGSQITGAE